MLTIKQALLSVSDKSQLDKLANFLVSQGVKLIASGGTYQYLIDLGYQVTAVADLTLSPEILDGRVKTLHPKIHGAILARGAQDQDELAQHQIEQIELVVCNLYPFSKTLDQHPDDHNLLIENIDIGGPTLIRASAKNYAHRVILVDPDDYQLVIDNFSSLNLELRQHLASKAFNLIVNYDQAIANYFNQIDQQQAQYYVKHSNQLNIELERVKELRYGENPHQLAGLYRIANNSSQVNSIINSQQLQGKELSYNNILDGDTALALVQDIPAKGCVIVKHANPCGVAYGDTVAQSFSRALEADPKSAFGGVIAFNQIVDQETAELLIAGFYEVVIAPSFSEAALELLATKSRLTLLACGSFQRGYKDFTNLYQLQGIRGGLLVQNWDVISESYNEVAYKNNSQPNGKQNQDVTFGLQVVKYVKSNAIVLIKDGQTIGIGAGQPNRSDSVKIAIANAKLNGFSLEDAVCVGDAFFPFADSLELLAAAGVKVTVQPGGSLRDSQVIAAAQELGIIIGLTSKRHFRH